MVTVHQQIARPDIYEFHFIQLRRDFPNMNLITAIFGFWRWPKTIHDNGFHKYLHLGQKFYFLTQKTYLIMRLSVKVLLCISNFEFKIVAPEGALNQSKLLIDNFSKNGFKGRVGCLTSLSDFRVQTFFSGNFMTVIKIELRVEGGLRSKVGCDEPNHFFRTLLSLLTCWTDFV